MQVSEAEAKGFSTRSQRAAQQRGRSKAAQRGWQGRRRRGFVKKDRPPRPRDRQAALAIAYPARCPSRQVLIDAYLADGGRSDGAETFALVIHQDWRLCKVRGAHAGSTGPRRALGLAKAGRPRVSRTVRRHRARAVRLGIARYHHVHRGRDHPGQRDFLRVEIVNRCPPACGSRSTGPSGQSASASGRWPQTDSRICDAKRRQQPCHSPPGAAKVPAAARPAETTAPGGGGLGGAGKAEDSPSLGSKLVGSPCCEQPLSVIDSDGTVWEAECESCGRTFGVPPSQQRWALAGEPAARSTGDASPRAPADVSIDG